MPAQSARPIGPASERPSLAEVPRSVQLIQPPGSRVTTDELVREVGEYFTVGATVRPGGTVVDVGANVGAFSLAAAERCGGDVRLVCFEPCPSTFEALETNFARHPVLKRTRHTLHRVGLAGNEQVGQELAFYNTRRFPTNATFDIASKRREFELFFEDRGKRVRNTLENRVKNPVGRSVGRLLERGISALPKGGVAWWVTQQVMGLEQVKAQVDSLDRVLQREGVDRVDLLKVDVEGFELSVLQGLGPATWPRIRQVILETHDRDGRLGLMQQLFHDNGLSEIRVAPQTTVDNGLDSVLVLATRP